MKGEQAELGATPEPPFHCGAPGIYRAIVEAHQPPEWCVLSEVADATSGRASRRADAVAMNMWASKGLEIRGFEIKVSRSDLKRELADSSKSEPVGQYCHTWSLAYPAGMLRPDDPIPPAWGLFEVGPKGGRFRKLPHFRPAEEVKAPTRMFTAAIARAANEELARMRNGQEWIRRADVQGEIDKAVERGRTQAPDENKQALRDALGKLEEIAPLFEAMGLPNPVTAHSYDLHLGNAVEAMQIGKALLRQWGGSAVESMERELALVAEAVGQARKAVARLKG
jgi:hypothetical protein